jgi:hypothetical protein
MLPRTGWDLVEDEVEVVWCVRDGLKTVPDRFWHVAQRLQPSVVL